MRLPGQDHIVGLFRHERRLLIRFIATSLGRAALSMAAILLIKEFLSGVLGEGGGLAATVTGRFGPGVALGVVAALLLVAYVGGSLCTYDNQIAQQRIIKVLELGMMERLIRHLLGLSIPFFDRQSHGDIIQAVRQDVTSLRVVVISLARLFLEGMSVLALAAAAFWLSPSLALWALVVLPVAALPIYWTAKRTLERSFQVRRTGYVLFDVILQMLRGARIIKAYRGEQEEARTAILKGRHYFDQLIEMVRVRSLAGVFLESLAGLGIVVVIVVGGLQVMQGALSWPSLLAFLVAVRALHGPLNQLTSAFVEMQNHGASVQRIADLLETRPEVPDRPGARALARPPQRIAFDHVAFSYAGADVLRDLSFEVRAGETLGIAGPSGAGKTTLLNLVARFYDPTDGAVRFDGTDLRDFRLDDVYGLLAVVTQEPFLFSASIRDNIRCGRPGADDTDIEAAARAAEIHDDILAMPRAYETVVGVGGQPLSGGQAQRLNIARALLKNAPLLLLDEATSSLDSLAEEKVQRAIDRLMVGRTSFVVAHRLSTLRNAQRILVLDRGRAVGIAPHDELLLTCPLYRRMWATQQVAESSPAFGRPPDRRASGGDPPDSSGPEELALRVTDATLHP